ncbi:MAG: DUF711 family protein [Chloroflexi bacterium]|nr:DUF711 family protein [Chloroflexota bacterium]
MKIRSVTGFLDITSPLDTAQVEKLGSVLQTIREALTEEGYEVQTLRLATQALPLILEDGGAEVIVELAKDLQAIGFVHGVDYTALGPIRLSDGGDYLDIVASILEETENVFASVMLTGDQGQIHLPRVVQIARLIQRAASMTEDGFTNLRLTASANVKPWSPFFPAAYHGGGGMRVAIATESADLAVSALTQAESLEAARHTLIDEVERHAKSLTHIAETALEEVQPVTYQGIDFSLAPFPDEARSIGAALERLGLRQLGGPGTLMAAAFLTDSLDRATFKRTGFSGLMLPVLEDRILAARAEQQALTVSDLLMFSAVCGTGLDTIPLPGNIALDTLTGILLDVAALALRLDKPLTARLMPLPGKQAGDETDFSFEYFANSRVLDVPVQQINGLLAAEETLTIHPYHK